MSVREWNLSCTVKHSNSGIASFDRANNCQTLRSPAMLLLDAVGLYW